MYTVHMCLRASRSQLDVQGRGPQMHLSFPDGSCWRPESSKGTVSDPLFRRTMSLQAVLRALGATMAVVVAGRIRFQHEDVHNPYVSPVKRYGTRPVISPGISYIAAPSSQVWSIFRPAATLRPRLQRHLVASSRQSEAPLRVNYESIARRLSEAQVA